MKQLSLHSRMIATVTGVIAAVLAVLIFLQVRHSTQAARKTAFELAYETTYRYGAEVQSELNRAMLAARTVAQTFEGMKLARVDDRALYNSILNQVLSANSDFQAIWSVWEPDALDAADAAHAGRSGHDLTGRFIPLWHRQADAIVADKVTAYAGTEEGNFYEIIRRSGRETILTPRALAVGGATLEVTGVAVPVSYNGETIGVVGVELATGRLQDIIESIRPYQTGYAALISSAGTVVAHARRESIGNGAAELPHLREAMATVRNRNTFTHTTHSKLLGSEVYEVFVPIQVGIAADPWAIAVSLPMGKILASSRQAMVTSLVFGGAALVVIGLIVALLARSIARPLRLITSELNDSASLVSLAARSVTESSQGLAEGATQQAASLVETGASLEEMLSMTLRNNEGARQARELSSQTRSAAEDSTGHMAEMSRAMDEIKASSDDVAKIIKTIDEIAFQTNILALNAAVEAA
ncbi:MAG TPA: hypothetical protein DCY13_03040, partial [Verrucomicrobiales bacterium]|nr:hypothetical protein [Verrucomicrobiales bacterium]